MGSRIVVMLMVLVAVTTASYAQSFRGKYVVVAKEITLPPDSTGVDRRLRFGDTVNVIARPTATTFQVRVGEEHWIVQQEDLIRAVDFVGNAIDTLEASSGKNVTKILPYAYPRQHTFRVGYGAGPTIPFNNDIEVEVGLAWSLRAEVLIDDVNTHIGFGYHAFTMAYRNSFGDSGTAEFRMLSMGASYSFGSVPRRLTPYVSLLVAINTEGNNDMLFAPGIGMDWYVSPNAVLFGEVQPWLQFRDIDLLWMPITFGIRCAL